MVAVLNSVQGEKVQSSSPIYMITKGTVSIVVDGVEVEVRENTYVGENAAIGDDRNATVVVRIHLNISGVIVIHVCCFFVSFIVTGQGQYIMSDTKAYRGRGTLIFGRRRPELFRR